MTNEEFDCWKAALRSDEYEQNHFGLTDASAKNHWQPERHCCLGVYQAVNSNEADWSKKEIYPEFPGDTMEVFIEANDLRKLNFPQIADLAETMRDQLVTE